MENQNIEKSSLSILYLEDSKRDFELIRELLTDEKYDLKMDRVEKEQEFVSALQNNKYDVILSDFNLPEYDAFSALTKANEICPNIPFIIISGAIGEDKAIELIKRGAVDYVLKDKPERLPFAVKRALEEVKDKEARKKTEITLKQNEERYRQIFKLSPDSILIHDLAMNILDANNKTIEQFGYSKEELLKMKVYELHPESELNNSKKFLNTIKKTDSLIEEIKFVKKDGSEFLAEINPCKYILGKKQVIHAIIRDITNKQKFEEAMQRSQKLESLGILAGGIAHDFNNLLSCVYGYIELAQMETKEDSVLELLSESIGSIERIRALTNQLMTFARGGEPIKKLNNLFPFVQEATQFALSGSSVSSSFDIEDDLWSCDYDKNQIGQVVDNLVINALQAMPNGGTIDVTAQNITLKIKEHSFLNDGNYVKLSITDHGTGIPKTILPHIFDPYYTTKTTGHGLGLATCYSIVKKHGGYLEVESDIDKGSTFFLYLPAFNTAVLTKVDKATSTHSGSGTFLVMDDEESLRILMQRMLEAFGYSVVLKKNGNDTLDFFKAETKANRKLTGMIFDLTIPGAMGGKETINEIRKINKEIPVFVASGYSNDPIMANPQKYGFTGGISKPFLMEELSEILDKYLKK